MLGPTACYLTAVFKSYFGSCLLLFDSWEGHCLDFLFLRELTLLQRRRTWASLRILPLSWGSNWWSGVVLSLWRLLIPTRCSIKWSQIKVCKLKPSLKDKFFPYIQTAYIHYQLWLLTIKYRCWEHVHFTGSYYFNALDYSSITVWFLIFCSSLLYALIHFYTFLCYLDFLLPYFAVCYFTNFELILSV